MTSSLGDILSSRLQNPNDEIEIIKSYVLEKFQEEVKVNLSPKAITIVVKSAALAGSLRLQLFDLQEKLKTDKRLIIRIN